MNWTEAELTAVLKRLKKPQKTAKKQRIPAKNSKGQNKLEASYADHLQLLVMAKVIKGFEFEPDKLKLAWTTTYTPDFKVFNFDGSIEYHEVKGFWRDDARVKLKVAAHQYPQFKFRSVEKKGGAWVIKEIPPN